MPNHQGTGKPGKRPRDGYEASLAGPSKSCKGKMGITEPKQENSVASPSQLLDCIQDCLTCNLRKGSICCKYDMQVRVIGFKTMKPNAKKPNGKLPAAEPILQEPGKRKPRCVDCGSEKLLRIDGEIVCTSCGSVQERMFEHGRVSDSEKFGRGPQNFAVFGSNLGSTTKTDVSLGAEPIYQVAVASVRGSAKYNRRPMELLLKSCPRCSAENRLRLFGEPVYCENTNCGAHIVKCTHCGAENIRKDSKELGKCVSCRRKFARNSQTEFVRTRLAEQVIRWLPVDPLKYGSDTSAVGYNSDLRALSAWTPVEDDFAFKKARELFSERFGGELTDEDASRLAAQYMKRVRNLVKIQRKALPKMLESLLDSVEGVNN